MKNIKHYFLISAVMIGCLFTIMIPSTVGAAPIENNTSDGGSTESTKTDGYSTSAPTCGGLQTSLIDCKSSGDNPIVNLLLEIINFLAVGVGIAVVGGIIWGGMLYASSNGDSSKAKQGITTIVNAVLGLLLFIFTYALVNYLVPGGLFN